MIKEVESLSVIDILKNNFKDEIINDFVINPFNKTIIYEEDGIKGILNYDLIYDRIEINYVFVFNDYRMQGIGSKLINYLIVNNKFDNITLEVNVTNKKAINLYKKFGFTEITIRKKYYHDQDAIMMIRMG
ncbi:MAG: GNAT family N-acetyltransferase [Bacilli bacterium]|nr:GNAT family N-acetyltransferase [Bacilli bacterium]